MNQTASTGTPIVGLLTIVFVVLKLTHVIDWSWWWVLSPLWISLALGLAIWAIVILVAVIATARDR